MLTSDVRKMHFARFEEGDDLLECIKEAAETKKIRTGAFFIIGALRKAVVGFYKEGNYVNIELKEHLEIASCTGNISIGPENEIIVHAHMVVSNEKGKAFGGHLFQGNQVGPTAELVLFEGEGALLKRVYDEKTKLRLLDL